MLTFSNPFNVTDGGALHLNFATGVTTAVVGGTTYVFVAGQGDDGVSVFSVAANGTLTNAFNVSDAGALELDGAIRLATEQIGSTTYLFVPGHQDNGVSVFSVAANGALTNVANVTDDGTLKLAAAVGVTTALSGGNTYLFVAGETDSGVSVFSVAANGALTNVANVSDNGTLNLSGAQEATTAIVGGNTYLFVAGFSGGRGSAFPARPGGSPPQTLQATRSVALGHDGAARLTSAGGCGPPPLFSAR